MKADRSQWKWWKVEPQAKSQEEPRGAKRIQVEPSSSKIMWGVIEVRSRICTKPADSYKWPHKYKP